MRLTRPIVFLSFGTNDLTQMTFGFSRDDIKGFMPTYLKEKVLPIDPFQTIGFGGVGELMKMGIEKGRHSRTAKHGAHLKVGICGEHGGDSDSLAFCHGTGMDNDPLRFRIESYKFRQYVRPKSEKINRQR